MEHLYIVTIVETSPSLDLAEVDRAASEKFGSLGKLDFSLSEERVDEILGKDAFCGGELSEELLLKIESVMGAEQRPSYFWESEEEALSFEKYLTSNGYKSELRTEVKSDWNESWRKSFKEIKVTDELRVVPSWEIEEDTEKNIYIYPGMGFGTGNHETTFLCLLLFEKIKGNLEEGARCLDFGCGSGILGIGALKKLRSVVDFVDIDKDALDNCVMNLEYNNFENYSTGHGVVLRERFTPKTPYPLVFANILENVLELEQKLLTEATLPGGFLIVSGLLDGQQQNIIERYKGFDCLEVEKKGDWVAVLFKRKPE